MMWDEVMSRVLTKLGEQTTLQSIFGDSMRMASEGSKLKVPSLEYTILSDVNTEIYEPIMVQIDLWTLRAAENRQAERIVRTMLNQRTSVQWDGVTLLSELMDAAQLAYPDRSGFVGRGLRFRFSALKQHLTLPAH